MLVAGFLLAGGRSTRMGSDKGNLRLGGRTLLERLEGELAAVCDRVAIVGPAEFPDDVPGLGPAGGILTALRRAEEWNLIVAVDMPGVTRGLLAELLDVAKNTQSDCVIPVDEAGRLQPLCSVYHRRCLPVWEAAVSDGTRKVAKIVTRLTVTEVQLRDPSRLCNVNTPGEWRDFLAHETY